MLIKIKLSLLYSNIEIASIKNYIYSIYSHYKTLKIYQSKSRWNINLITLRLHEYKV